MIRPLLFLLLVLLPLAAFSNTSQVVRSSVKKYDLHDNSLYADNTGDGSAICNFMPFTGEPVSDVPERRDNISDLKFFSLVSFSHSIEQQSINARSNDFLKNIFSSCDICPITPLRI